MEGNGTAFCVNVVTQKNGAFLWMVWGEIPFPFSLTVRASTATLILLGCEVATGKVFVM